MYRSKDTVRTARIARIIILIGVAVALPLVVTSHYYLSILVLIGNYALATIGLNLVVGYTGQISFGHAAFYGLGAYTSAILTTQYSLSPWVALILGAVVSGLAALLIGIPTLKLKGHFLALGTLGFAEIVNVVLVEWGTLTKGPSGIPGIPYFKLGSIIFDNDVSYYYLTLFFIIVAFVLSYNLVHSRAGRALRAIKGSEVAAQSLGIDIARRKLQVFVLCAVFGGVAGSLYAHYVTYISPANFGVMTSVLFVVMAVTGGVESIWGALIGAALITGLSELLRGLVPKILPNAGGEIEIIAYGFILIVVLIFSPDGIFSSFSKLSRWVQRKGTTVLHNVK